LQSYIILKPLSFPSLGPNWAISSFMIYEYDLCIEYEMYLYDDMFILKIIKYDT